MSSAAGTLAPELLRALLILPDGRRLELCQDLPGLFLLASSSKIPPERTVALDEVGQARARLSELHVSLLRFRWNGATLYTRAQRGAPAERWIARYGAAARPTTT
jgi:hypothetical protein